MRLARMALLFVALTSTAAPAQDTPVANVNGTSITEKQLEFLYITRRIPDNRRADVRQAFLDELIDRTLISAFLDSRKVEASQIALDHQVKFLEQFIRKRGEEPDKFLIRIGYSKESLRAELAVPLRWDAYVRKILTAEQLRAYWNSHRPTLDGTQLRAAHILRKIPDGTDETALRAELAALRKTIQDGSQSFADAARAASEAPTAEQGGDIGFVPYRGRMHPAFSNALFALKPGEISEPVRTPFGLHLITITDTKPGQLSLEDVRREVLTRMGQDIRAKLVAAERKKATIEIVRE